jgi:hypothetical protein
MTYTYSVLNPTVAVLSNPAVTIAKTPSTVAASNGTNYYLLRYPTPQTSIDCDWFVQLEGIEEQHSTYVGVYAETSPILLGESQENIGEGLSQFLGIENKPFLESAISRFLGSHLIVEKTRIPRVWTDQDIIDMSGFIHNMILALATVPDVEAAIKTTLAIKAGTHTITKPAIVQDSWLDELVSHCLLEFSRKFPFEDAHLIAAAAGVAW